MSVGTPSVSDVSIYAALNLILFGLFCRSEYLIACQLSIDSGESPNYCKQRHEYGHVVLWIGTVLYCNTRNKNLFLSQQELEAY